MINWNEVTVGETEIARDADHYRVRLLARSGDYFWTKGNAYHTFHIDDLSDWTIYDPWVDVSDQCRWVKMGDGYYWTLYHNGKPVSNEHVNYKSDGRRVWKRKEGQ